jgi:glutamate-1-semialdehyde 2,1-aminomutase
MKTSFDVTARHSETVAPEELEYRQRTRASARYLGEAREHLPGGDSRSTLFYRPYPAVFASGKGCRIVDLDGNELIDFTGNHSSMVHGYGHPEVQAAVRRQLERGTAFPGATEPQLHLAHLLTRRIPSIELVRFTNSGTEAMLNVLRVARRFTGRRRVARAAGAYHGALDELMLASHPDVLVIPFNDPAAAVAVIEAAAGDLAAVVLEPVQGSAGMIPADPDYLGAVREITRRAGILLVLDEVVSFRLAWGGGQAHFGVTPDLTILGKLIGGGFPLGAFGGRRDVMVLFDPSHGPPAVPHPGSYNANPVSLVAGAATLELLTPEAIDRINAMGEVLRAGLRTIFADAGVPARVTGAGSLFGIHRATVAGSPDSGIEETAELRRRTYLGLYNRGVLIDPRGVGTISTALGQGELDRFLEAAREVVAGLGAR